MDYYLLTDLAAQVGHGLAISGAETFRVEDTIRRILRAYGIECEVFAIPNCLTISFEAANGKPLTIMKRIGFHGNVIPAVTALLNEVEGDEKTGVQIVAKALEEPIRQIAANAGLDGSVILEKVRTSGKNGYGFDAYKEEYCDMIASGIVDPAKVTRSALENAASVSGMVLTTESLVADKPQPPAPAAPAPEMGGMGGMY